MNRTLQVARKELREMLRDKRVISGAFVMPVLLIFLMMMLFGAIGSSVQRSKASPVHVVDTGETNVLLQALDLQDKIKVVRVPSLEEAQRLLEKGDARIVVQFEPGFEGKRQSGNAKLELWYDSREMPSSIAKGMFEEIVSKTNDASAKALLAQSGISPELAEPIHVAANDTSKGKGMGASPLAGLLPYLIVLWAFYGGMSIVGDLVAGEKERGTLETLLISPATRASIALGKFLSLAAVCLASSLTSLLGIVLVAVLKMPQTKMMFPEGFNLSPLSAFAMLAALVPLVLFFAGLLLSVSAWAKNMREAQTYLTLVSFVVLMPAIFSQMIGLTDLGQQAWVAWTPILNTALVLREALLGKLSMLNLFASMATSLVLAVVMWRISVGLFQREQVLTRV